MATPENAFESAIAAATERAMGKALTILGAVKFVLQANVFAVHNRESELAGDLRELNKYLEPFGIEGRHYLRSVLFLDLVSEAELYFAAVLRAILIKHPKKLGNIQFKLSDIMDASSVDDLVDRAVEEYLQKLFYKRPNEYLVELCQTLSVDPQIIEADWPTYIEAKARRDLGVHNDWICNATYLRKVSECSGTPGGAVGARLIPSEQEYVDRVSDAVMSIVSKLSVAIAEKHTDGAEA